MRRSRSPIRYRSERSPMRSSRHFSEFREGSFSISSLSSCSMGTSERHDLHTSDNGTRIRDRDVSEKRRRHEKNRYDEREKINNRDRNDQKPRGHSRCSHKIKSRESNFQQHEMEETLDPSICNFQGHVSYQSVEDVEYETTKESTDRLDRLEKLVEMLVDKKLQPESQHANVNAFVLESHDNPYELNPRNTSFTTSMWLNKINEECMENNYDERRCIQFMQSKMTGLMKAWFKTLDISDYTWPEIKMLITKTFPDNVDFAATLRLLVERYKRSDETITQYYFSKMYLIEACKITGINAVSCLIDGLADVHLEQEARSNNCLTPETLYSQFLSKLPNFQKNQNEPEERPVSMQMLRDVEFRAESVNEVSPPMAMPTNMPVSMQVFPPRTLKKCFTCKKIGHFAADCRHAPKCYRCNQAGHIAVKCPRQ